MARSAANRTSSRSEQLTLLDLSCARVANGQDALALPEQVALLEQEVRYYRRILPALIRAGALGGRRPRVYTGAPTSLARWLTDGQRLIGSVSHTLDEQRQLEERLQALERGHRQVREEMVHLFADESDSHDARPSLFVMGWLRTGLAVLILAIVVIVSVPYFMDWWQAVTPSSPSTAPSDLASPRRG
jgi:hypothetical protein